MKASISGHKDTDREILLALSDKDLISACATNKYLFTYVCDDNFFYRKLFRSYPDTLKYFHLLKDKNYKSYYLKVVYYVSKLKEDFNYSYVAGNPEKQYNIFKSIDRYPYNIDSTKYKEYLLEFAAREGEYQLVKEAVKIGANIQNYEAIGGASYNGHFEIVKYLIEQGVNIHINDDLLLRDASEGGKLEVVKYLVSQGADIHAVKDAALRDASRYGHYEVVKYLVEHGASIHRDDDAIIKAAVDSGNLELLQYLIINGENIDNMLKYTIETLFLSKKKRFRIIKYLISIGANKKLALKLARKNKRTNLMEYLRSF